jgi:hypothetical protein
LNPDDLDRFLDEIFADQSQDAAQSPLNAYFPVAVIERLRASPVAPSRLFVAELKRLETDPEAEQSFTLDLFRLLGDEDGFEWPVDDLGRCLALAVFREHTKQLLSGQGPEQRRLNGAEGDGSQTASQSCRAPSLAVRNPCNR